VGCGGLIRGSEDEWLVGFSKFLGKCNAFVAKLWRVLEGLWCAKRMRFTAVELNVDSLAVVNIITSGKESNASGRTLVEKIRKLLQMEWEVKVKHSYREANRCAVLLCASVSYICPTSDKRVKVEHLISKRTHKPIALRFWVRVWCLSCLWGCSSLDVDGPPSSPRDLTIVSEPRFDEGYDRGRLSVAHKAATRWYKQQVAPCAATTIQASKKLPLWEEHDKVMDSHLRESVVVCKCELYVPHRIKE